MRRALRMIDVGALEARLAHFAQALDPPPPRGDGSLARQQVRVQDKSNEITAVPQLLQGRDLRGTVTTMDALLTQQAIAQQILDQGT